MHIASHLVVSFFPSDLYEDARVQSLSEVALGLAHELAREQNVGGGAVAGHILLRGGSAGNDGSGRVLDLLKQRGQRKETRGGMSECRRRDLPSSNALCCAVCLSAVIRTISSSSTLPSLVTLI